MKPARDWHHTTLGRTVLFLGGIRFAVPVLLLVAAALAWGTWIESTSEAANAARLVYGSWWFIALMALICLSLVLSVITRFPWRRKHIGFITVHASLVMLVVSAFVSFFTRVEGQIALSEGEQAAAFQLKERQIEILSHDAGQFLPEGVLSVDGVAAFEVAGVPVRIDERWANTTEEFRVTDDGANPLHAVEIRPAAGEPVWVGQSEASQPPQDLGGVYVRVLPVGESFAPAAAPLELTLLTQDGSRRSVPEAGTAIGESGWTVEAVEHFERATVTADGLAEREDGAPNPSVMVHLVHTDGSRERHIAFERFNDSIHKKTLAGESHSPYAVQFVGAPTYAPLITFERVDGVSRVTITGDVEPERFEQPANGAWQIDSAIVGMFEVAQEFTHARGGTSLVEAPGGDNTRPALVISYGEGEHTTTAILPWTQRVPLQFGDEVRMLRYGPVLHDLPFTIQLADFRKLDYPGTDNAMAYESDVNVTFDDADAAPTGTTISMNKPLEHEGWKVYQSGFLGSGISVFQVTRDPGLGPTYVACTALCIGILITFYSRSLSRGHPGMPAPFGATAHAATSDAATTNTGGARHAAAVRTALSAVSDPAGNGVCTGDVQDDTRSNADHGVAADPAPGPGDAVVHVRRSRRGAADRAHELV